MNQELAQYIADAKKHGLSDGDIKKNLLDAGWEAPAVEEALASVNLQNDALPHLKSPEASVKPEPAVNPSANLAPATIAAPVDGLSEAHFASPNGESVLKKPIAWVGVLVLLGLAVGGYFAYAKFYDNPAKVWGKFETEPKITTVRNTFAVKFTDPNDFGDNREVGGFQLKNIYLEITGNSYTDITDIAHPQVDGTFKYTFGAGNTSVTSGLGLRQLDQDFYLKVGDNPFLASLVAEIASKKYDWVKLNIKDLQDTITQNTSAEDKETQAKIQNFIDKLGEAAKKRKIMKMEKYLGKETIGGVSTFHYKNTLNKDELKALGNDWLSVIEETAKQENDPIPEGELKAARTAVNLIVDKFEVKEFETWIGKDDGRLYKVHFVSNMPSFIKLAKQAENQTSMTEIATQVSPDDQKRLSDVKEIASALSRYSDDNAGFYPEVDNGQPSGISPKYIGRYPTPPTTAGGSCPGYYNAYWYNPTGMKTTREGKTVYASYELTFCLSRSTDGYKAGILKISPFGIDDGIACPGTEEQCKTEGAGSSSSDEEQQVRDFINKMDFSAELRVDLTYSDYDKKEKIEAPSEFFNLNKFIEDNLHPNLNRLQ